ncbi:MAG: GNAT family N-acetyltransferase [Synergistaceae bacterium]|nr:GNAT family N-acetyltransferase [Synergistaceae bacterium]
MNGGYFFYDSKHAVFPEELANLYRFTRWGKSRSIEDIARMLDGTSMCFSVRHENHLVAFCRMLTDFVYRASLWDIMVHPDHQGKKVGTSLLDYALGHPSIKNIPLIITYTSELGPFLAPHGFTPREGAMMLMRRPIEYS